MKVAYVAGPYRSPSEHGVYQNIAEARYVSRELWKMGFAVICPHMNTAFFGGLDVEDKVWLDGDLEILSRCDLVVTLPNWSLSVGAIGEVNYAKKHGIPVIDSDNDDALFSMVNG